MSQPAAGMADNLRLYPWFKFCQNLVFWQAIWFLYFQSELSAAQAVLLYAVYDVATTALEVPSGYMSDRLGRRKTLVASALAGALGAGLIALGGGFAAFVAAQICLGAAAAFASGTDNAFLYESLVAEGRDAEVEAFETRAWQFTLSGLALSAVTGGSMATFSYPLAFGAGAVAQVACLGIAWRFVEPPHNRPAVPQNAVAEQWGLFRDAMRLPVLVWLFGLSVLMYGFSHLPFVFGQPFIAQALTEAGIAVEAPLVSGVVTALMMGVSALAVVYAVRVRARMGLSRLLLLAFGIQVALVITLALTPSLLAIGVLLLRMVPNSLSKPFIIARMQPLLTDAGRATYMSIQSFVGRLLFAASLLIASFAVAERVEMTHAELQMVLGWYALAGVVLLGVLALTAGRAGLNRE